MATVNYIAKRGDTIDLAVVVPGDTDSTGLDLTDATFRATLKRKLDDATNDNAAAWKHDYNCNDAGVCENDDPTTGIVYIQVPGDKDNPDGSTYNLKPGKVYTLDVEFDIPGYTPHRIETCQARIKIKRDGTRRIS